MFKIFHRGHKVQFNEDDIKKQEINKRNSYFYNTETANAEDANEERRKANNLSVSSANKKALGGQLQQTKRYSSIQNLAKGGDAYDDGIDHEDIHGFKEKLMNRYTNVTTLLMRSFRKAKNKKKKENEEKRKSSIDEGSAAIYRPINRDEIVPNLDRLSQVTINADKSSRYSHQMKNQVNNKNEDEDEDQEEDDDDDNQDDEEDCNAVPICVNVKSISNDFVDYPIKIGNKTLNEEKNLTPKRIENKVLQEKVEQKPVSSHILRPKPELIASPNKTPEAVKLIYNPLKPQAPVKPPTEVKSNNQQKSESRSDVFVQSKLPTKCTPLIDERKKIFEANNIGSSNLSLNKITYVGSFSKKTAVTELSPAEYQPRSSTVNANMMKHVLKNTERANNNGTASMIMTQKLSKTDYEAVKSTLSIPGISSPQKAHVSNGIQKAEKNILLNFENMEKAANKLSSGANVKRIKSFTQQLNEMLEQYKKMGSTNSISSNDKTDNAPKKIPVLQKKEINENNRQPKNDSPNTKNILLTEKNIKQIISKPENYETKNSSPTGSVSSTTIRIGETSKINQTNSRIPVNINRIQATSTSNNKNVTKIEQNSNLLKPSLGSPVIEKVTKNKYGIIQNSKESPVSQIKEAYLKSLNKNSGKLLDEKNSRSHSKETNSSSHKSNKSPTLNLGIEKKKVEPTVQNENDIYSSLKFSEPLNPTNDKAKIYFKKFYGDVKDKMKTESYIQAISDIDERQPNSKSHASNELNEPKKIESEKKSVVDISGKSNGDEFKSLVNVLDKQDVDFKLKFFNCLMPKLWDASLPYEEYVQLNKLMTALFGEKYHELDQSTRNLAQELRRKSSFNKFDLKEQFEKSQAYEKSIKRLVKEYLTSKSPSKELDESLDFADIIDEDEQSFKTVNHLINTLKRRQLKEYQRKFSNPSFYSSSSITSKLGDIERLKAKKENSRSDYETYSDNTYSSNLRPYKLPNLQKHRINNLKKNGDNTASLFLRVKEQDDFSEDTDYVSKQSDIWTQSFESSDKNDGENIYGTVNYRNRSAFLKNLNNEEVCDKLGISIQAFNQLKQEAANKESLKEKIQAYNRISMNNSEKTGGISNGNNKIGYSPKIVRKNSIKKPSYPDIVIESTLDNSETKPVVTSFQPSLNILTNQRNTMSSHSMNNENKASRPKSPSNNTVQKLQTFKPKLLADQLTDISSYNSQEALNNSNNDSFNLKAVIKKFNLQNGSKELRLKDYETNYINQKLTRPDILNGFKIDHSQQSGFNYYIKSSGDKSPLNGIKSLKQDENSNDNNFIEDTDYESIFNRKKSELMTKELMNSFNEFYLDREIKYSNSKKTEPSIYERFDIYDALY
jgi:hypothetical protein